MAKREAKRIYRQFTTEESQRWRRAKEEAESEREEILARGRKLQAANDRAAHSLFDAFKALKADAKCRIEPFGYRASFGHRPSGPIAIGK